MNYFSDDGTQLIYPVKMSDYKKQRIKVVFLRQSHLRLITKHCAPELFFPAISLSPRMTNRLGKELSKNRLWYRYSMTGVNLMQQGITRCATQNAPS